MNQEITAHSRKAFESAVKMIGGLKNNDGLFPQSSFLRIDQLLVNGQGNYTFDPMKQNGLGTVYDRKLDRNDGFLVIGMLLAFNVTNTGKPGAGVLATSIPDVFKAMETYGTAGNVKDISAVYNGKLTLKTGTSVTYDGFPTQVFKRETVNLPAAGTAPAVIAAVDFSESMYFTPEYLLLAGTKDQSFELTFPSFAGAVYQDATESSKNQIYLSLYLQGFLVKNGAVLYDMGGKANEFLFP